MFEFDFVSQVDVNDPSYENKSPVVTWAQVINFPGFG